MIIIILWQVVGFNQRSLLDSASDARSTSGMTVSVFLDSSPSAQNDDVVLFYVEDCHIGHSSSSQLLVKEIL